MKKISIKSLIIALFLLTSILIFFNVRDVYRERDVVDVLQIARFQEGENIVQTSLIISNQANESISDDTSLAMFDMFSYLAQRYGLLISYGEFIFDRDEYRYYMTTGIPMDQRLGLVTETSLNFNEQDTYFYTNHHNRENGVYFFLLDYRLDVTISPIMAMGSIRGGEYTFVATSQEELDASIELFLAEFELYIDEIVEFDFDLFDVDEAIGTFLTPIVFITTILNFLLIILYIHVHSKKIAIFKTMGFSLFEVGKRLFLPLLAMIFLAISGISTLLFIFFVGVVNIRTIPIIWTLIYSGSLQLLLTVFTMVISCLLLVAIPTYSLLKNNNVNRFLMGANYVVKIIVLITFLPAISSHIDALQDHWQVINHIRHYESHGSLRDLQFSPRLLPRYRGDGYASLFMSLDFNDPNPEAIYENELLYEYHQAYRILNEAGAIFSRGTILFSGEGVLDVNENFLIQHPILDADGDVVDLSENDFDFVYLIPESFMERGIASEPLSRGHEVIFIRDEQDVFDYSLAWGFNGLPTGPYVISVFSDNHFRLDASPFNLFIDDDVNELLSETFFHNRILVSTLGDELSQIRAYRLDGIIESLWVMVPILVLVVVIIIQYSYLYAKVYQKRIYTRKLVGHHPFSIFFQLLVESSLAVIAAISVIWYLRLDLRLFILILVFDMMVYLGTVFLQSRRSLVLDVE